MDQVKQKGEKAAGVAPVATSDGRLGGEVAETVNRVAGRSMALTSREGEGRAGKSFSAPRCRSGTCQALTAEWHGGPPMVGARVGQPKWWAARARKGASEGGDGAHTAQGGAPRHWRGVCRARTISLAWTSAPFSMRRSAAAGWLLAAATYSGVLPCAPAAVGASAGNVAGIGLHRSGGTIA